MKKHIRIGHYVLTKNISAKQPYHFVLKAPNNEIILTSENYVSHQNAINGINSVMVNGPFKKNFVKCISKAQEPYFVLKASNGKIIGTSEMYSSINARDNGIVSVMNYSSTTKIKDL